MPVPSHDPLVPHGLVAPTSAHWLSGSIPAGIEVQVPTVPVRLQDWQTASQPVLQQTPCSQNPEVQSVGATQATPGAFLPQIVPLQT